MHSMNSRILQVAVGFFKLLNAKLLTHKAFHYAYVCHVFLDSRVESVYFCLHDAEAREAGFHQETNSQQQKRNADQKNHRQRWLDPDSHDQCRDHHARCADSHSQEHIDKILHLCDIVCQPRYQRACGKLVNIGKGKILNLCIGICTDILPEIHSSLRCKESPEHAARHHGQRCQNHLNHNPEACGSCQCSGICIVDHDRQKPRHDHFPDHFHRHKKRSKDKENQIRFHVFQPFFHIEIPHF